MLIRPPLSKRMMALHVLAAVLDVQDRGVQVTIAACAIAQATRALPHLPVLAVRMCAGGLSR